MLYIANVAMCDTILQVQCHVEPQSVTVVLSLTFVLWLTTCSYVHAQVEESVLVVCVSVTTALPHQMADPVLNIEAAAVSVHQKRRFASTQQMV